MSVCIKTLFLCITLTKLLLLNIYKPGFFFVVSFIIECAELRGIKKGKKNMTKLVKIRKTGENCVDLCVCVY